MAFLSITCNPSLILSKITDLGGGVFTQILTGPLQNYQGHPRQKKNSEKTSLPGGAQENLTSEYNVIPGSDSTGEKCISNNERVWLKYFFFK